MFYPLLFVLWKGKTPFPFEWAGSIPDGFNHFGPSAKIDATHRWTEAACRTQPADNQIKGQLF